jgi:VCBS repeat-containing protein
VTYDSNFNINSPFQTGSIAFTETDPTATTSAYIINQNATAHDAMGNEITLTGNQMAALEAAFTIPLAPSNTINGAVDWTYNPDGRALNFLAPAETAVVTSTVEVTDSDGNSDTATVTVTLQGTLPSNVIAGIDINAYPDATVMNELKQYTNLSSTGFYLWDPYNPNHTDGSWMGHLQDLAGWQVKPIYVGYQAGSATLQQNGPIAQAQTDATQAATDLANALVDLEMPDFSIIIPLLFI